MQEVKEKMDAQIEEYIIEALMGEDREFAAPLLTRKAPLSLRAKYHFYDILSRFNNQDKTKLYSPPMPMQPARC